MLDIRKTWTGSHAHAHSHMFTHILQSETGKFRQMSKISLNFIQEKFSDLSNDFSGKGEKKLSKQDFLVCLLDGHLDAISNY